MTELRERLQTALGAGYRIENELGGGGMSRVFLAEEVRLGRRVVVKVLPPEMSMGVSVDRFEREIQLAAKLQHPHIVPLLTAGASEDLLYYIMPYIEGESLRAKLGREGELPVAEALRILRDVLDALAYAHGQHVVHRDIKPDNVLLSGKHALVTDFGVAKAVADATRRQTLTSMGVALGTPLYMAPEQAAADPHIDHRADLYAAGATAYEMLCGRPPFPGVTPQAVLAAHLTDAPEPVTKHRTAVPEALNALILRCLEKKPADRWQRAEDIVAQLEAMLTPTGGTTPVGTQPVLSSGTAAALEWAHPVRVTALFGLASVGVLAIVYALVRVIGLPDWVFLGAVALLAAGLPVMLVTGHHERRRALARSSGQHTAPPDGVTQHFTWRKALLGGAVAFVGLGALSGGYMAMRALGIGPVGTLLARGTLGAQERILVAEFDNATPDSALGETVTDLLRIALAQSRVVTVMEPAQVADVLQRMRRDRGTTVTAELADEVAAREGIKAFVTGEVRPVGGDYVVSARLVAAGTGDALVAVSEPASGSAGLIKAVDRVSARLRERIGESLRTLRSDPPLDRVTTGSLEALRLYAQANRFADHGDIERAIAVLQQAVSRDTTFAMGYRRLAALYLNTPATTTAQGREAIIRAYALRDRLSDRERYQVEGLYADGVEQDFEKAATAYMALLERYPTDNIALNNLGRAFIFLNRFTEAEGAYRRAIEARVAAAVTYTNLTHSLLVGQRVAAADSTLALLAERFPGSPEVMQWTSNIAAARRDWDGAAQAVTTLLDGQPAMRAFAHQRLAGLAQIHGGLGEASRHRDEAARVDAQRQRWTNDERDLLMAFHRVERAAWLGSDPERTAGELDRLWQRNQPIVAGRPPLGRRYQLFVPALAAAGRPSQARRILEELRSAFSEGERGQFGPLLSALEGEVLLAEGRPLEAAASYREAARASGCDGCLLARVGRAYDQAGEVDSALAYYRRYVETPPAHWGPPGIPTLEDERWLAPSYRRLGELHEQRGDRDQALDYYGRFVELWNVVDGELEPMVEDVKQRMARLAVERP
jgi:tetratricopeptide (TPR) repeat protein/tRNA A-37 threonylcarbamoyl transferase component Bud32